MIYNLLYEYFNTNNLLVEEQHEFCTNHSTEYAAIKDHFTKEMDTGNTHCALFIDLAKAFDTLSFDINILQKLKYYGIVGEEFPLRTGGLKKTENSTSFSIIINLELPILVME